VYADVCGPMQNDSFSGYRYYVNFKDDFTKFRSVYFLKQKSEVASKLKVFLAEAKTMGHTVKQLLTDGGGEFDNNNVRSIVQQFGIKHRFTMPYTPEQNGAAERDNRTLIEAARSMLLAKELPNKLWAEAVSTATYVINRCGPVKDSDKSPFELWSGKSADVSNLKIFGTVCYVHVPKAKRQKLDSKAMKGYLVGYCDERDGYRVFVPEEDTVVLSRDITFKNEEMFSSNEDVPNSDVNEVSLPSADSQDIVVNGGTNQSTVRDRREVRRPVRLDDYIMYADGSEPTTYTEAVTCENAGDWQEAMTSEMSSLLENNTWTLVDKEDNMHIVDNKWVFKLKVDSEGSPRYKARLVAKGYSQTAGIDYEETFSPVARYETIRTVLSVAASENMSLMNFDVKTAFLYGELDTDIYMRQPEGYRDGSTKVCKLNRSLYGLKQSPRCWNKRFSQFLQKHNLIVSDADPCLFYRNDEKGKMFVVLYVDDGLVAWENAEAVKSLIDDLISEFKITTSTASSFLSLQIKTLHDGSISINQAQYTLKVLSKYGMSECHKVATPIESNKDSAENSEYITDTNIPYREAVGSLLYLATGTRPDIAYAVSIAAQAVERPTMKDWCLVKRIMRYLKGTVDMGIVYHSSAQKGILKAYSDADFAGDLSSRKSTTGVMCTYMDGAVLWSSQKQRVVALSTTEAELIAACEAAKDVIWLTRMLTELTSLSAKPVVNVDNMSTIKLIKNATFHRRSKHIDVRFYFIREQVEQGNLDVEHVPGVDQLADILTKPLHKGRLERLRDMLSVVSVG
jgi:hypothetical protein